MVSIHDHHNSTIAYYKALHVMHTFRAISSNILLLEKALNGKLIIPDFKPFLNKIDKFYYDCIEITGGEVNIYWSNDSGICSMLIDILYYNRMYPTFRHLKM